MRRIISTIGLCSSRLFSWLPLCSLRSKLFLVVGLLACVAIAVAMLGLHGIKTANDSLKEAYSRRIVSLKELKVVGDNYAVNIIDTAHKVRNGNMTWAVAAEKLDLASHAINQHWGAYRKQAIGQQESQLVERIELQFHIADSEMQNLKAIFARQDKEALAAFMIDVMYSSIEPISAQISELIDLQLKLAREEYEQAQTRYLTQALLFLALVAAGLSISLCMALWIIRNIFSQLREMVASVENVAAGNLAIPEIHIVTQDEVGRLGNAINLMVHTLRRLVGQVGSSSEQVAAAAQETVDSIREVNQTAQELLVSSNRLFADAAVGNESILKVSKALVELSSLMEIAKIRAGSTMEKTQETTGAAAQGRSTVAMTVERMKDIETKITDTASQIRTLEQYTAQISTINQTITSIAAQTNLLALNAAIEAARAGDAGRGFAVVAREVTALALQSRNGAQQVSELVRKIVDSTAAAVQSIQASRQLVAEGVQSATQADSALEHIVSTVAISTKELSGVLNVTQEEVAQSDLIIDLIDSLATVIENTASSAKQVTKAVDQTTSIVETLAVAAAESHSLSSALKNEVGFFKINEGVAHE